MPPMRASGMVDSRYPPGQTFQDPAVEKFYLFSADCCLSFCLAQYVQSAYMLCKILPGIATDKFPILRFQPVVFMYI